MIPTMLLAGLVIGRWWVVPLGALAWMVLVLLAVPISPDSVPLAAALGAANAAVGVGVRLAAALGLRATARLMRAMRAA